MDWKIVTIEADDTERLNAIAKMHMKRLDFGPMAPLGEAFVRTVGYELPLRDNLMSVACLEVDGELAGFLAYTERSEGFYAAALKGHLFRVFAMTLAALVKKPSRLLPLYRAAKVIGARESPEEPDKSLAEITAIAVDDKYTSARFVRDTGLRVSEELIRYVKEDLRRRGARRLRGIVDGFNKATVMMFAQMNASITPIQQAGEPMYAAVLDLEESRDSV